jgi:hypothetical protein
MAGENYGPGVYGPYILNGAPVAGVNEVQTLTFAGPASGGNFRIAVDGVSTGAIAYNATGAGLATAMNTALDAAFGASQIVATAGTYATGAGTMTLTFSGSNYARRAMNLVTITNNLTGTAPTVAVAETTPGVTQSGRDFAAGAMLLDVAGKKLYINTGTAGTPTWTVVGAQV